jgi:thymidylate synthase (FAD)
MENIYGIGYSKPEVILLQDTGIGVAEIAARTCYDSFDNSENECVKKYNEALSENMNGIVSGPLLDEINEIEHSELLDNLAHTYFHHSILEHANLSFLIKGTSRGVLQEHARHRIQAISVRSTRYTMSGVINAFVASVNTEINTLRPDNNSQDVFVEIMQDFDMFVTADKKYNEIQLRDIFNKFNYQLEQIGSDEFIKIAVAKSSIPILSKEQNLYDTFKELQAGSKKRNVGDAFKHVVNDNFKVDMVVTFNIRSLKNYFDLRDSGAAYIQIQWLAKAMKEVTPNKYLDLITKRKK